MITRPALPCKPKSRRKVVRRALGLRAKPRSNCRYASIWACQYSAPRPRHRAGINADV